MANYKVSHTWKARRAIHPPATVAVGVQTVPAALDISVAKLLLENL